MNLGGVSVFIGFAALAAMVGWVGWILFGAACFWLFWVSKP